MNPFVNFNQSHLNNILINVFNDTDPLIDSNEESSIDQCNQSSDFEQHSIPTTTIAMTNDHHPRQYCLIVFNNPRGSKILQRRKEAQVLFQNQNILQLG